MQFQDTRGTIPFDAPDSRFIQSLVVTFFLDTQKNSVRGESISIENTYLPLGCPVMACARRFLHLRDPGPLGSNHGSLARARARGAGPPRTAQSLLLALGRYRTQKIRVME